MSDGFWLRTCFERILFCFQYAFDRLVAERIVRQRQTAGGLQQLGRSAVGQLEDPQAGAIGLLGMAAGRQRRLDEGFGLRADLATPLDEPLGRPFQIPAVIGRHVLCLGAVSPVAAALVAGDPFPLGIDLDQSLAGPDQHRFAGVLVRDAVVVFLEADVIVEVDFGLLDLEILKWIVRQRLQGGLLDLLEQFAPRVGLACQRAVVEPVQAGAWSYPV